MLIIAHRGASRAAPENTLPAFRLALQQGAEGIELDTYQVGDDIVVFHDRYLERTTNGTGRLINKSVCALGQLNAGQGASIPLLGDVLSIIDAPLLINIEIKGLTDATRWLAYFLRALKPTGLSMSDILVSSFNHCWLRDLKVIQPELQIGALTASYPLAGCQFAQTLGAYSVHVDMDVVDKALITDAHRRGMKIFVYTVDRAEDWQDLLEWGADGFFTNIPDAAKEWKRACCSI